MGNTYERHGPQMPWYGQKWEGTALSLEILSHGHTYTASAREVYSLPSRSGDVVYERRMFGALTGTVDTEGPPKGVGKT